LGTIVVQPGSATAQPAAKPHAGATIEVVADRLDTPRGVLYDQRNRRVLVAEAGEAALDNAPCGQAYGGATYCYGPSGAVLQYSERDDSTSRIAWELPSIGAQNDTAVLGIHDIALGRRGELIAVFGLSGAQPFRDEQLGSVASALGTVATIDRTNTVRPFGDLVAYEQTVNPYKPIIDSNPFGVIAEGDGAVVADAAGNSLLRVARDGTITTLATFPLRVPDANPDDVIESVPTAVARGRDGAYYVGELSGYPYYKGEARVWRVVPGQAPTVYAQGFTNIVDVTFDKRGRLLVLEIAKNGLLDEDQTGRLVRVERDGSQTTLVDEGITNPGGVAVAGPHEYYITNRSASVGNTGQLLRVRVRD
jgi:hypothetical protein